ncbi:MAG: toast rack family protein [Candidatus Acidiferrum sp.]|jgi:hypothetical protein
MASNSGLNTNPPPGGGRSVIGPLLLIAFGVLFLYASWKPGFSAWRVLGIYWPLILIFLGLGKIWDNTRSGGVSQRYSSGVSIAVLAFVVVMAALLWHSRSFSRAAGYYSSAMRHTSKTVELGGAKSVRADIEMSAGELTVGGGSMNLVDAKFDQRDSEGEPRVDYSQSGGVGELKISQDRSGPHISYPGHDDTNWNLQFGAGAPLDLKINLGAGQSNLNLRGLPVTKLELNIGAGQVNADLTGDRQQDLDADIEGGVGEAEIRLPRNVGVTVEASGGIGSIDTHGLKHEGGRYVNDTYGKGGATIRLKVEGGIGHIELNEE